MEGRLLNGRYRLVSRIAAGSMGQVWRCYDEALERDVAVKLLLSVSTPTPEALARFDREARLAGALSCPSIVTVHDYGHAEFNGTTTPYLIMELLAGHTLAKILDGGQPPELAQALEWTVQVCDALAVAHRAGVVHRDVKPDNVMVTPDGTVKVLDFGIARFAETEATRGGLTATGMFMGTAEYMSPEQAQGRMLDARSDLYSLGCLLYALLTGRPPFEGDTLAALVFQHISETPAAPSTLRPEVSQSLDRLVLDLLAKEPSQRPADAAAVRAQLTGLFHTELSHTEPDRSSGAFADLLHRLGVRFSKLGRLDEALRPTLEATDLYRALARTNPDRYTGSLAASLTNLGACLSDLGRRDEALSPALEATDLYRTLAKTDPDRYNGNLAGSLTNLAFLLAEQGRTDEAIHHARQAADLRRTLAQTDPDSHNSDLAASLTNLGADLSDLGRRAEALPLTLEAADLYRTLARTDPDRYNGDLAGSLTNLAFLYSELGRGHEAEQVFEEAERVGQ